MRIRTLLTMSVLATLLVNSGTAFAESREASIKPQNGEPTRYVPCDVHVGTENDTAPGTCELLGQPRTGHKIVIRHHGH
jgi:hypothetical protein